MQNSDQKPAQAVCHSTQCHFGSSCDDEKSSLWQPYWSVELILIVECEILLHGQQLDSLERLLRLRRFFAKTYGKQQLLVLSLILFGKRIDARGRFCLNEVSLHSIEQPPPALSWPALDQLGVVQPQFTFIYGFIGISCFSEK